MQQQITKITIPEDLAFADLQLARESDGSVSLDWAVIERICQASNLAVELVKETSEDNLVRLLVGWYQAHRQNGGAPDPVAEDLIAEVVAEEQAGQHASHPPGRA